MNSAIARPVQSWEHGKQRSISSSIFIGYNERWRRLKIVVYPCRQSDYCKTSKLYEIMVPNTSRDALWPLSFQTWIMELKSADCMVQIFCFEQRCWLRCGAVDHSSCVLAILEICVVISGLGLSSDLLMLSASFGERKCHSRVLGSLPF